MREGHLGKVTGKAAERNRSLVHFPAEPGGTPTWICDDQDLYEVTGGELPRLLAEVLFCGD